jgi:hypothetical protein
LGTLGIFLLFRFSAGNDWLGLQGLAQARLQGIPRVGGFFLEQGVFQVGPEKPAVAELGILDLCPSQVGVMQVRA